MPFDMTEIITYFGSMTCGFSSLWLNGNPSSAWKESRGDNVPEVSKIDLGFISAKDLIVEEALKHQNPIFLFVAVSCIENFFFPLNFF